MINAVLVFNNAGQPRLTKFYTQLVRFNPDLDLTLADNTKGNQRSAATDIGDLRSRSQPPCLSMQLPAVPNGTRILWHDRAKAQVRSLWHVRT